MRAIHERGVVHNSFAQRNIVIHWGSGPNSLPQPKIIDFERWSSHQEGCRAPEINFGPYTRREPYADEYRCKEMEGVLTVVAICKPRELFLRCMLHMISLFRSDYTVYAFHGGAVTFDDIKDANVEKLRKVSKRAGRTQKDILKERVVAIAAKHKKWEEGREKYDNAPFPQIV